VVLSFLLPALHIPQQCWGMRNQPFLFGDALAFPLSLLSREKHKLIYLYKENTRTMMPWRPQQGYGSINFSDDESALDEDEEPLHPIIEIDTSSTPTLREERWHRRRDGWSKAAVLLILVALSFTAGTLFTRLTTFPHVTQQLGTLSPQVSSSSP